MEYRFTNKHAYCPLIEPLLLLLVYIPFFIFIDSIPNALWGKAIFLLAGIPFIVIWLIGRVIKVKQSPQNLSVNLEANTLTIDDIEYSLSDLHSLFIWQKDSRFGIDLEMANGLKIRTCVVYELSSSFDELKTKVVDFNKIDMYSYDEKSS
jgi:hypothetical protein